MNTNAPVLDALSNRIIGCAITVSNALGIGFLEKIYENASAIELRESGLAVTQQHGITVTYRDRIIGEYAADLLVENAILVELKAARALEPAHRAQCLNYLRATGMQLCLLMNLGTPRLEIRRVVLDL
jgi:GxxExxY protein